MQSTAARLTGSFNQITIIHSTYCVRTVYVSRAQVYFIKIQDFRLFYLQSNLLKKMSSVLESSLKQLVLKNAAR